MEVPSESTPNLPLRLGCPVWTCDAWGGTVYPSRTARKDWLAWYTSMFNTVEGNSSFYAIPTVEQARRWAAQAATGFRFCMKFPREISHECGLQSAERATGQFLDALSELAAANVLGPSFLQLGPKFGPDRFEILRRYLEELPAELPYAVEVRHRDWFDSAENEQRLDSLLSDLQIDKVLFDSRPLFQTPPDDEVERVSQSRKPRTPLRRTVTGPSPMLRLVGRNRLHLTHPFIADWIPHIVDWIASGLEPVVFTHSPDDRFAPSFAREFWERLAERLPGVQTILPKPPEKPKQLDFSFE